MRLILLLSICIQLYACGGGGGGNGRGTPDNTAPVITLIGNATMSLTVGDIFTDPGASAMDNVDVTVNVSASGSVDTLTAGQYTITYTATDAAGNTASAERTVTIEEPTPPTDTTAPEITLLGSVSMTIELGTPYLEPGATATDNIDGSVGIEIAGSVDEDVLGIYTVTYTATDSAFNVSSITRTVTVVSADTSKKSLDTGKWHHQTVIPNGWGWFNGELQHYTDRMENSYVSGGTLKIVAKKEQYSNAGVTKQYTSARLNSKFAFTYGRVEVRAKMPTGFGTWPAIWMLGKNITERGAYWETQGYGTTSWPACGEIDIMEHWGSNQNTISSAMHTPSSHGGTINKGSQYISTATTAFHIYTLDWTAERMVFAVNGDEHYTYNPADKNADTWPFDADQFLLLNVAIESNIDSNFMESAMEVDYVRVYNTSGALVWSDEFD